MANKEKKMMILEIEQNCLECQHLKFNGIVKMPSEDGYDCLMCKKRVVDFYLIRNGSAEGVMKKLYPPYGIPEFCPIMKDFEIDTKEEMEFV